MLTKVALDWTWDKYLSKTLTSSIAKSYCEGHIHANNGQHPHKLHAHKTHAQNMTSMSRTSYNYYPNLIMDL